MHPHSNWACQPQRRKFAGPLKSPNTRGTEKTASFLFVARYDSRYAGRRRCLSIVLSTLTHPCLSCCHPIIMAFSSLSMAVSRDAHHLRSIYLHHSIYLTLIYLFPLSLSSLGRLLLDMVPTVLCEVWIDVLDLHDDILRNFTPHFRLARLHIWGMQNK
jgi:hypothetical protein